MYCGSDSCQNKILLATKEVPKSPRATTEKRVSQWEELMRKFSKQHEEQCKAVSLDMPRVYRSTKYFPTGSKYKGTWDILGMSGYGVYTFPHGVIYEGEFEDGVFHGMGKLLYPNGCKLKGRFHKGVMMDRKLIFDDGLEYDEEDWKYCKMPDRRFSIEYKAGLQPAGRSNMTARLPSRKIPPGFYDTGDGFYNPTTRSVYKADDLTAILRSPSIREQKWIIENCRSSVDKEVGPRPDLYEHWLEPQVKLPPVQPPANNTRLHKISTFNSFCDVDNKDKKFYGSDDPDKYFQNSDKGQLRNTASSESNLFVSKGHNETLSKKFKKRANLQKTDGKDMEQVNYDEYDAVKSKMISFNHSDEDVSLTSYELKKQMSSHIGITSSVLTFTDVEYEQDIVKSSKKLTRLNKNINYLDQVPFKQNAL